MRIIAKARLKEFWAKHNRAKTSMTDWYTTVKAAKWQNFADIRSTFNSVDQFSKNNRQYYIFNVGDNRYRIIAAIHFNTQKLYIRAVLTHKDYSKGNWKERI